MGNNMQGDADSNELDKTYYIAEIRLNDCLSIYLSGQLNVHPFVCLSIYFHKESVVVYNKQITAFHK